MLGFNFPESVKWGGLAVKEVVYSYRGACLRAVNACSVSATSETVPARIVSASSRVPALTFRDFTMCV